MAEVLPVEPDIPAVMARIEESAFAAIADKVPAVMAYIDPVMVYIAAVGARRLGLGGNSGKEKTDGE